MAYTPTEADRNTVKTMAACGIKHEDIARCLGHTGIDDKTLRKHFRDELDTASVRANSVIASRLYAAADRGEPWAVCFWLKTRARWQERVAMEQSGADGNPLKIEVIRVGRQAERSAAENSSFGAETKKPPEPESGG